ncbi:hypothetical protein [Lactobacillus delbrueckii]|uniref:hypothetical protein n=1 Tax=Lactobacillus delbrueckii TaxID=1584 RepID=UPI00177FBE34|nr:hypothetical protein [Lactobacillus delbrueckii]MBD5834703.1 hypothetical protein [Lactobacillus delbrueckii]
MSVVKSKRSKSRLEVIHNYYKLREQMTFVLFNDFGYSRKKAAARLSHKYFLNQPREDLTEPEKVIYDDMLNHSDRIFKEFVERERSYLTKLLQELGTHLVSANGIYITIPEEAIERRLEQDKAIAACYSIVAEFNCVLRTLPISASKYAEASKLMKREIGLIKGWRQSDNKRRKQLLDSASSISAANFANVDSNGNADCNGASNSNGVRPDFKETASMRG